jgi:hypothetical protein
MSGSPIAVGTCIADRYVVTGELGAGGMGVVVRARDERLGRDVAMKVLPAASIGDEQARRRLVREARAAAGLEHPSIVHIYDVGETADGGAFLVMELVKGQSLRQLFAPGALTPARIIDVIVEVGRALSFAHTRGFVHRDIKPDNVLVRDDGRAVVLDFGLAKASAGDSIDAATVTAKGSFVGTPAYMPPEQARGEQVDARGDQFALAVTAFEGLSGQLPWEGRTALELVSNMLRSPPRRLRDLRPSLSPRLEDAIARGLQNDAAARFPTMDAFVAAVQAGVASEPVSLQPRSEDVARAATIAASAPLATPARVEPAASVASTAGSVSNMGGTGRRRGPQRLFALGAGLAAVAALAGVLLRPGRQLSPTPDAAAPAALAREGSMLACPALTATAYDFARAEWLGAAAAHLVCERAAIGLGGPSRTLLPAELLGVPRVPTEDFPKDAFGSPGSRETAIRAASAADAWVDGTVDRSPEGFHVAIVVRARGGGEAGRGEGTGTTLAQSVRAAMQPLFASGVLPRLEGSSWLRAWFGGASVEAALALHDLHVAILTENPVAVREECARVRTRSDAGPALTLLGAALCADKLGEALPPRPSLDSSGPFALATSASTLRIYATKTDDDRAKLLAAARALEDASGKEPSADARALLAAVAAELQYARADADEARRLALVSVQASAKEVDVRGTAWHRLSFTSTDHRIAELGPHLAWVPWEPFPYSNLARARGDSAGMREGYHQGAALAGRGYWLVSYGEVLVDSGDLGKAAAVAAIAESASLSVLVMRAEGRLRGALDEAVAAIPRIPVRLDTSTDAARVALQEAELSSILERPLDHMQDFVDRFIVPDPSPFSRGVIPLLSALGACVMTPKPLGPICVGRLAELYRSGHFGAAILGGADVLTGAERYVAGDLAGAAKAWRSALTRTTLAYSMLRTPIADLFDRLGEPELAGRVDAPALEEGALPSLALARAAMRAEKRGDCAAARGFAGRIVGKWEAADEKPPVVDRMRKLMARCTK